MVGESGNKQKDWKEIIHVALYSMQTCMVSTVFSVCSVDSQGSSATSGGSEDWSDLLFGTYVRRYIFAFFQLTR